MNSCFSYAENSTRLFIKQLVHEASYYRLQCIHVIEAVYHGVRALDHNGSDTEKIKNTWDGNVGIFPGETRHERVRDN